ncbi:MAG TPA: hypothetical protein EYP14_19590, partial [Planctomycetaceae bacterium]|nr:hypothetical protein [Planctomycetaceae bacterium]
MTMQPARNPTQRKSAIAAGKVFCWVAAIGLGLTAGTCAGDGVLASESHHRCLRSARPVWPDGREREMNLFVGFTATIERPADDRAVELRVAASSIYRLRVNGRFVGHGPARGPHGFSRIDRWDITKRLSPGRNVIAIEVAGYNANSYYLLDQPAFLQAEAIAGDRVLASTAGEGVPFRAKILDYRVQKVQRYSFQRPFIEVYRLRPDFDRWLREGIPSEAAVTLAIQPTKTLLPRRVLYPTFTVRRPQRHGPHGRMERLKKVPRLWKDRSLTQIGPRLKGYPEKELAVVPTIEAQHYRTVPEAHDWQPYSDRVSIHLSEGAYQILDLGENLTGFLGAEVQCSQKTRLWFLFDELLTDEGDVNFRRLGCASIIDYTFEPGRYAVEAIEPYTMRYVKLVCVEGDCTVRNLFLREYAYPEVTEATFRASDERLNRLFAAGVSTFRQNALDLFMDCPSRERAGWLCDSFFTARVEHDLADASRIERNFFENFLLPERFEHLPDGMLPMCYPADHYNGNFIPNWALWFVVQLEEYLARSGDRATVDALRPKVLKLFDYFRRFENADGLLEKLERWVFVEWSAANRFVQDVNYPTNMLYAAALAAAGRMYRLPELEAQAGAIRTTIRRQSFDGEFFVDNAVRKNGKLQVTRNRTEVCQYFAFFFGVATPESHPKLWARLRDQFGPDRKKTRA